MVDVERDVHPVARDVLDLRVDHRDVDRSEPDEVPDDIVHHALLGHGVEVDAELAQEALNDPPEVLLLRRRRRVLHQLEGLDKDLLQDLQEFVLLREELRLDDLIEVLV